LWVAVWVAVASAMWRVRPASTSVSAQLETDLPSRFAALAAAVRQYPATSAIIRSPTLGSRTAWRTIDATSYPTDSNVIVRVSPRTLIASSLMFMFVHSSHRTFAGSWTASGFFDG
jgi:hypothetical protein